MEPVSVKAILQSPHGVLFVKNPRGEWELPGGRPEAGEGLEAALAREVEEECGLTITSACYLDSQSCEIIPGRRVLLVFFRCEYTGHAMRLSEEHTDYRWVDLAGEQPTRLPDFYWQACSAAMNRTLAIPASPMQTLDYPLPTGECDRRRLQLMAAIYDPATTEFLLRHLPSEGRILEIGCGHGQIARWMAERSPKAKVLGLDSSPAQIAVAKASEGSANLDFRVGDITRWAEEHRFDLIVCRFVLLHLQERAAVLQSLLVLLGSTGTLVIEEPSLSSLFCVPRVPAFEQANAAILAYGRLHGLDYDCAAALWEMLAGLKVEIQEARFSQPTVWSEEHKQVVRLSFQAFSSRLVEAGVLEPAQVAQIVASLVRDYESPAVISSGLRTLQIAVTPRSGRS
ncbi:methyltransferase domain-containing protein [Stenotrophomonas rhizophila]|uniref:methyltransferase domain-containing protein n=1 Tax=Stenotrophomonas rhizophila TaxID=216778 RepID=UPI00279526D9|nr:methyltransferase domain-containing protein [Stenotrophomonas rhizophila]MCC7634806.1 methyltransferase domain-containing protein [Stenotrophomonas rhizophila]MCC7664521.1 methyltransferase domain-containing protein [Stenotrophomonas rhizophila]